MMRPLVFIWAAKSNRRAGPCFWPDARRWTLDANSTAQKLAQQPQTVCGPPDRPKRRRPKHSLCHTAQMEPQRSRAKSAHSQNTYLLAHRNTPELRRRSPSALIHQDDKSSPPMLGPRLFLAGQKSGPLLCVNWAPTGPERPLCAPQTVCGQSAASGHCAGPKGDQKATEKATETSRHACLGQPAELVAGERSGRAWWVCGEGEREEQATRERSTRAALSVLSPGEALLLSGGKFACVCVCDRVSGLRAADSGRRVQRGQNVRQNACVRHRAQLVQNWARIHAYIIN